MRIVYQRGRDDTTPFHLSEMVARPVIFRPVGNVGDEVAIGKIQHIAGEDGIFLRHVVVHAAEDVVFAADVGIRYRRAAFGVANFGDVVGQRIQRHDVLYCRGSRHVGAGAERCG